MIGEDQYDNCPYEDNIESSFKRYMFFLEKEYQGKSIPVESQSFLHNVDYYIMECNPKVNDDNIERYHKRLFNKCNEMLLKTGEFQIPKEMLEPIRLAR